MLTVGEWADKTEEITNELEHNANIKLNKEITQAQAYHDGYVQACEDFSRRIRHEISYNQG